ncbi:MAG: hypothetical protein ABI318_02570, partial [Chthoniobacteraceae bacterium]
NAELAAKPIKHFGRICRVSQGAKTIENRRHPSHKLRAFQIATAFWLSSHRRVSTPSRTLRQVETRPAAKVQSLEIARAMQVPCTGKQTDILETKIARKPCV